MLDNRAISNIGGHHKLKKEQSQFMYPCSSPSKHSRHLSVCLPNIFKKQHRDALVYYLSKKPSLPNVKELNKKEFAMLLNNYKSKLSRYSIMK